MLVGSHGAAFPGNRFDILVAVYIHARANLIRQGNCLPDNTLSIRAGGILKDRNQLGAQFGSPILDVLYRNLDMLTVCQHILRCIRRGARQIGVRTRPLDVSQLFTVQEQSITITWIINRPVEVPILVVWTALFAYDQVQHFFCLKEQVGVVACFEGSEHLCGKNQLRAWCLHPNRG